MPRIPRDQAEGLRRLLDRSGLRVISVSAGGGGNGKTWTVINLAAALAELGRDVLILDEGAATQGVTAALGLKARFDLEDLIRPVRALDELIVRGPAGIMLLPLARGARSLAQLPARKQQCLLERCGRFGVAVDTLLVDAAPRGASALLRPGGTAEQLIVLEGGNAAAVTAAYALIKSLNGECARRQFHVLVSNVVNEDDARLIFGNMARVARRYLQVALEYLGHVPPDDKLQHAARLRLPVVTAFPGAAAARSFRRMARAIAGWPHAEDDGSGFNDFMRRLIHSSRQRSASVGAKL